ncbi:VOC family protein [Phenylobacterium sp.]|uniref:VOC family protein n=1 Tax=Phenylobacterium sp. TaxID=1871053 RepID=UPI0035AE279E
MSKVSALSYLRFNVGTLAEWDGFAQHVLGVQRTADGPNGRARYRMDSRAYRYEIVEGQEPGLAALGFEVLDGAALDALQAKLEQAGVKTERLSYEAAADRAARAGFTCQDPNGNAVEIIADPFKALGAFVSPTGAQFVAEELGIGHVVLSIDPSRFTEMCRFYMELLGFKLSDHLRTGEREAAFLHCNPRHHTVAIGPGVNAKPLMHFMVEYTDMDTVGYALDACWARGHRIESVLGKHGNDLMVSFYADTPVGTKVEIGHGGRLVDDATWVTSVIEKPSLWGHQNPKKLPI